MSKIIFITGTDTGVGKTLLTGLLLVHLRELGKRALAIKPFCTGGRADAELLYSLQGGELTLDQINPFYFPEPLAPLVAARIHRRSISLAGVLQHIQQLQRLHPTPDPRHSTLLIEGAGGLLVPLGEGYTWANVLKKLACRVIVVSANRLGTINHTLLTVGALQAVDIKELSVVMMRVMTPGCSTPDTRRNPGVLAELLAPVPIHQIPFLGPNAPQPGTLKKNQKKIKKVLARILA